MSSMSNLHPFVRKCSALALADAGLVDECPVLVAAAVDALMGVDTSCGRLMALINALSQIQNGSSPHDYDVAYTALMSYRLNKEVAVS